MPSEIEKKFHAAMLEIYDLALAQAHYSANDFRKMVLADGGFVTARKLLEKPELSAGFTELVMRGRPDLTVEALVSRPQWRALFATSELERAEDRLRRVGYRPPAAGTESDAQTSAPGDAGGKRPVPAGITREHVLAAITDLNDGVSHDFSEPTGYYLVHDGLYYAPKAVVGLAAGHAFGAALGPKDFSGGNAPGQANHVLRELGFEIVEKEDATTSARVTFDGLLVGEVYDRKELAWRWGYRAWNAIGRGIVTPAGDNKIILFVTREKQAAQHQYQDHFEGDTLHMEGETNHAADQRLVSAAAAGDEIHLFYRDRHHADFTYYGRINLREHELRPDAPSLFVFDTKWSEVVAASAIRTEALTHTGNEDPYLPESEGRSRLIEATVYQRSLKNRARALQIHGTACAACGFDFNAFYGTDLARHYIEVHHRTSVTEVDGQIVDPAKDLVPLCSNCHSMVHRVRGKILDVQELKTIIEKRLRAAERR